jgi:hypothetical protein
MEGYCSTGQSTQRAVVPVEEEEVLSAQRAYQVIRHMPHVVETDIPQFHRVQ